MYTPPHVFIVTLSSPTLRSDILHALRLPHVFGSENTLCNHCCVFVVRLDPQTMRHHDTKGQTFCTWVEIQILALKNTPVKVEVLIQLLYSSKSEKVLAQSKKVKVADFLSPIFMQSRLNLVLHSFNNKIKLVDGNNKVTQLESGKRKRRRKKHVYFLRVTLPRNRKHV